MTMCVSIIDTHATDTMAVKGAPASADDTTVTEGKRRNRRTDGTHPRKLMVSTQEACEMLGLKDGGTVRDYISHGKLEGKKAGNKWLITVRSIERFAFGDFDK